MEILANSQKHIIMCFLSVKEDCREWGLESRGGSVITDGFMY